MARRYKYITFSDRREISALYQANARPADIAARLGVTTATIYRELKRGETVGEGGGLITRLSPSRRYRRISGDGTGPRRTACKEVSTVTQFEKITQSPETLGAFLVALPVIDGPWDKEFHERYCADCLYLGCDACPHEEFRNNPRWRLTLEAGDDQDAAEPLGIKIVRPWGESGWVSGTIGEFRFCAKVYGALSKHLLQVEREHCISG